MSLVNDMLKDLEAGQREPLPPGVSLDDSGGGRGTEERRRSWLHGVALLAFVGAAFYLGLTWQQSTAPASASSFGEAELASVSVAPVGSQLAAAARPDIAQENVSDIVPDTVPARAVEHRKERVLPSEQSRAVTDKDPIVTADDRAENITSLLAAASGALREDRLTSPIEDNAFTRYQAVLLVDAEHPEALQGIKNIAERYLEFYATKLRAGDQRMANFYLAKAERVTSRYPDLAQWLDLRGQVIARQIAAEIPESVESVQTAASAEDKPDLGHHDISAEKKPESQVATQSVRVGPSQSELDKRTAADGRTLMQQRRYAEAESLLSEYLATHPDAANTRAQLFELHLANGNVAAARQQLSLMTDLARHEKAQLSARIAVQAGDLPGAMEALEAASPNLAETPGYYSYLAALYHKGARFQDAATIYQRLLAVDQSQATYWLGLAVSLDALNDRAGALRAFRYARRYGNPDAPSRAYVEERIQTLSG